MDHSSLQRNKGQDQFSIQLGSWNHRKSKAVLWQEFFSAPFQKTLALVDEQKKAKMAGSLPSLCEMKFGKRHRAIGIKRESLLGDAFSAQIACQRIWLRFLLCLWLSCWPSLDALLVSARGTSFGSLKRISTSSIQKHSSFHWAVAW